MSFIGIAINIWTDTTGIEDSGGRPPPTSPTNLQDRAVANVLDRSGNNIKTYT